MNALTDRATCATRPDTLLVLLPGMFAWPEEFIAEGFVAAVRERRLAVDIQLVDAHTGYYTDRSVIDRLRADVIEPAQSQGYRAIWLVGISIGGFGAMITAEAAPQGIAGVVALAPYLGARNVAKVIESVGGLTAWTAPTGPLAPEDIDLRLWRWLQRQGDPTGRPTVPPLYLGYGLSDRFAYSDGVLAAALPSERVFTAPGGHDWPVWSTLWRQMLDVLPLPLACPKQTGPGLPAP